MATDETPPRNRLIATIALITLCTLVALKFILTSYFNEMIDADRKTKLSKPEELYSVRADQGNALKNSPVPIDVAIMKMSGPLRDDAITPKQSEDTGPLLGWSKSPKALPKPIVTAPPPPPVEPAITDAGADGAKPKNPKNAPDGGKKP